MKRRVFVFVLAAAMFMSMFSLAGRASSVVQISSAAELAAIADNPSGSYLLTSDILLSGGEELFFLQSFSGELDGDGHKISGFSVTAEVTEAAALCGFIADNSGRISDVCFSDFSINVDFLSASDDMKTCVGIIAGRNSGQISGCTLEGVRIAVSAYTSSPAPYQVVTNEIYAGSVAGLNLGKISDCTAEGRIEAYASASYGSAVNNAVAGGIVGMDNNSRGDLDTVVEDCEFSGNVFSQTDAGGIIGHSSYTEIKNCTSSANVTSDTYSGGIVGVADIGTEIFACVFDGEASSAGKVGGITATASSSLIEQCANYGKVLGSDDANVARLYAGGICGHSFSTVIRDCYNAAQVSADAPGATTYAYTGGICGAAANYTSAESRITACHNAGAVSSLSTRVNLTGSIIGSVRNTTVDGCYYLQGTYDAVAGEGEAEALLKTGDEMQDITEFSGLDFESVWFMGSSFPCLRACLKQRTDIPQAPEAEEIRGTGLTVKAIEGCEYSLDGNLWQSEGVFSGLATDREYLIYARFAQTDRFLPSEVSTPLTVRTLVSEKGDINGNGKTELVDAIHIFMHVAQRRQLTGDALERADYNSDGDVTIVDAMIVFRIIAGKA